MALNYTKLGGSNATFQQMIKRFGVVTVMNAKVYDTPSAATLENWKSMKADAIYNSLANPICELDTLKIANVTQEGPTKTITGGQYTNALLKYGKTARLEMQDALGNADAIEVLCGGLREGQEAALTNVYALHFGQDFASPKTIVGDTFFIDQKTGQQVKAKIIFYQFLPDSLFNLTQDAEGDATVFDMNGDLLTTDILVSTSTDGVSTTHGVFYSILDPAGLSGGGLYTFAPLTGVITIASGYVGKLDGTTLSSPMTSDSAAVLTITAEGETDVLVHTVLVAAKRS